VAFAGSAIAFTQYIAQSATKMRKTLDRYLTDEIVANILETPFGLELWGERRKVTVLVSDFRGFSAICKQLPSEEVVKILNLYLGTIIDVINQYKGMINEFMGDGIFVVFAAPKEAIVCTVLLPCNWRCHK